jgi:OmcA/MtrC family decaheme c-type cytochrome
MPDSSGFAYQLLPVTADMEAGTYMVRFEGGDYSAASGTDFITHSTAVITFQVKTATEEFRVSGEACLNCHGTTRMHEAGAHPHNAAFATDECLGCHHDTGHDIGERVHGVPIANRVHAVHSANLGGDIIALLGGDPANRDWTHVTFPREIQNCNTCHNSQFDAATNTFEGTYKTLPYMMPCSGCHSGESSDFQGDLPFVPGVTDHMIQNGGPWFPKP